MKAKFPLFFAYIVYLVLQGFTFLTGLTPEEVRDLWIFKEMHQGAVPFRDFAFDYGILGPWIWHWIAQIFGLEIAAFRIAAIVLGLPAIYLIKKMADRWMPPWPAAFTGLAAYGILTFPTYCYTHLFSVFGVIAFLYASMRYFETRKPLFLLCNRIFSAVIVLIRPFPVGTTILASFSITMLAMGIKDKKISDSLIAVALYLCGTLLVVFISLFSYAQIFHFPMARFWLDTNFSIFFGKPFGIALLRARLPNPLPVVLGFWREAARRRIFGTKLILMEGLIALNTLTGYWVYLTAFLLPLGFLFYTVFFFRQRLDPMKLLLGLCAAGMGLYFHDMVVSQPAESHLNAGFMWTMVGFFLLQPGLILGFILAYSFGAKRLGEKKCACLMGLTAFWFVFSPKMINFRYWVMPMKQTPLSGIKGILLSAKNADELTQAVEILNHDQAILSKTLYSPYSQFEPFVPQKPAVPEYYSFGYLNDDAVLTPTAFPGIAKPITAGAFLINRLTARKSVIVIKGNDFHLSKKNAESQILVLNDYKVLRRIGSTTIYIPK